MNYLDNKEYKFYFITGSQHLYGEEVLNQVEKNTKKIVEFLNNSKYMPYTIVWKEVVKTQDEIENILKLANNDDDCAGVITFMHTFSPSKMWINGLANLQKPYCHFHTQYNKEIPFDTIDMDFMNLNQSAHGDREHGFIAARLRKPRKVVVGYYKNKDVLLKLADFCRVATGIKESKSLKLARFGDNMRDVAVTEGDKVYTQMKLGWSVNYYPIGDLVDYINNVKEDEIEYTYNEIKEKYIINTTDINAIKYQVKVEIALMKFLEDGNFSAFTTNFQALHGMEQLPGLACQRLMEQGYGFGGEGDWKVSALTRIMKVMAKGLEGGTSFMEDYTYHLENGNELVLGAHMLEVCPSIASSKPTVEVHDLGIGDRNPPARLKFYGEQGDAICVSLVDIGGRLRMIVTDVYTMAPLQEMKKLPVAGVMWKPLPDLQTAAEAWLIAGGAHHTVLSYALDANIMRDFAEMMDIEFIHIGADTKIQDLKKELLWNDIAYKLKSL